MGQWRPVSNLREQASRRPPVVIFFLCLLTLSITFVCVGLYSQNHDIKNPDIGVDWNGVLGSLAALKFCKHLNESDTNLKEEEIPFQMINHDDQISITTSAAQVSLLVPLGFKGDVPDKMNISTTLMGRQLGMKGAAAKTSINISFLHTDDSHHHTCLHFSTQSDILPKTPYPPTCPAVENIDRFFSVQAVDSNKHNYPRCFSFEYKADPQLTVLLTEDEKSLCRFHLLLVSAALLVLCVLLSICGVCSRSSQTYQINDLQKESLLSP